MTVEPTLQLRSPGRHLYFAVLLHCPSKVAHTPTSCGSQGFSSYREFIECSTPTRPRPAFHTPFNLQSIRLVRAIEHMMSSFIQYSKGAAACSTPTQSSSSSWQLRSTPCSTLQSQHRQATALHLSSITRQLMSIHCSVQLVRAVQGQIAQPVPALTRLPLPLVLAMLAGV
jgi:hypothetical protein